MSSVDFTDEDDKVGLKREIGLISAINLTLNLIIGAGIFVTPGSVLAESGSIGMSLVVWTLCGFISLLGALAFAELSTVVPKSGGCYAYFQAAFARLHPFLGPLPGFIFVWVMLIVVVPTSLALASILFADHVYEPLRPVLSSDFHLKYESPIKTAIAYVTLFGMGSVNYSSVKLYLKTQDILSYLKLFGCGYVIVGGIYMVVSGKAIKADYGFDGSKLSPESLVMVFYGGLYSFDGWSWLSGVTEEIKNPKKNIIRSMLIGITIVTVTFVSMNAAYATALTVDEITTGTAVAVKFGDRVFGPGRVVISVAVAISVVGAALSWMFYASRLGYVAARDGQMWEFISFIHRRRLTPGPAVVLQVALGFFYLMFGSGVQMLINFYTFMMWTFYGLTMITVFIFRRKFPNASRPFKVPLLIPIIVMIISLGLAITPLFTQPPMQFLTCILIIAAGVVVYYFFIYKRISMPGLNKCQGVLQRLMDVVPPKEEPLDF